jgi:hypothetical protein
MSYPSQMTRSRRCGFGRGHAEVAGDTRRGERCWPTRDAHESRKGVGRCRGSSALSGIGALRGAFLVAAYSRNLTGFTSSVRPARATNSSSKSSASTRPSKPPGLRSRRCRRRTSRGVRAIWRDAQPRTTPPMEWTALSTTRPTNRKARPMARNGAETICPIPLGRVMARSLMREPKGRLSGWLKAAGLRE